MAGFPMTKRTVPLALALLLAALATAALISYVRGVENRALDGAASVGVFVAKDSIPAGMRGEDAISRGLVQREAVPKRIVADGAVGSLDAIKGRVAAATIFRGEQIVGGRFVLPSELTGVLPIPAGRQAFAAEVDVPNGVGGFIQPGSRVSVLARLDIFASQAVGIRGLIGGQSVNLRATGEEKVTQVKYLLQDVGVLAVGSRVANVAAQPEEDKAEQVAPSSNKVLLTLAVSPRQAEQLAFAMFEGEVWFTLLPQGAKPVVTSGRTAANAFK